MAKGRKHALTLEEVISRTAVDAAKVAQRVGEDIRGDILRLSRDLEIHRRAGDREKVESAIRARIKRMNADLSRVMDVALGKAVKDANAETGLAVKYSADYTREILAMVQEQQGENLASVYSRKMEQSIIAALRNATVGTIQEAAVAGLSYGEQKKLMQERWEAACKGLGEAKFIDSGGHEWDSRDYFAMNVRTNAMRVYNDVLAGNVAKDGGDLVQVTRHGDPGCKQCFPWEGRILSLTGKTKGYPTYEECRAAGCFHPNCTHSIQTVDELIDADEIELQRGKESPDDADDPMKAAFDLDVARKQREGMGKDEAEAAVRRERLEAAARFGMPVEGAERVVQGLTDGEVAALTDGVKVPKFSMAKRHEEPRFTPGSAGGHVVMPRGDLTAETLKELPGVEERVKAAQEKEKEWKPPKTLEDLGVTADELKRMPIQQALKRLAPMFTGAKEDETEETAKVAELRDRLKACDERSPKAVELQGRMNQLLEEMRRLEHGSSEHDKVFERYRAVADEYTQYMKTAQGIVRDIVKLEKKAWDSIKDRIAVSDDRITELLTSSGDTAGGKSLKIKVKPHGSDELSEPMAKLAGQATGFFEAFADRAFSKAVLFQEVPTGTRAGYLEPVVKISRSASLRSAIHEVGHHMENQTVKRQKRVIEFYKYRTAGCPVESMRDATGNAFYRDDEVTKKDKFVRPYIGKVYGDGSTEVISMGAEMLAENPRQFFKKDPEHAMFTIAFLKGWL